MPIRKFIVYEPPADFQEVRNEEEVFGLVKDIIRELANHEDSRFNERLSEEVLEMVMSPPHSYAWEGVAPYEVDFSNAKDVIDKFNPDLKWKDIVDFYHRKV